MKISVIVPVYNAQAYLSDMIDSVLSQKFAEWELLLIVSKSEDNSLAICQSYAKKTSKIRVIEMPSGSAGMARNIGLKEAMAEYIMFVDADDLLPDGEVFERFYHRAIESKADIVVSNYMRLWKGNLLKAASHESFSGLEQNIEDFRFQGFFSVGTLSYVWGKLYRKKFLEENDISFTDISYAEDKLFNIQCCLDGARYAFMDEIGYIYRKNEKSISYQYNPKQSKCWITIAKQIRDYAKKNKTNTENKEIKNAATGLIEYILFFGIFFATKMEYTDGAGSIKQVRDLIKNYHADPLVKKAFKKLVRDPRVKELSQLHWRVMLRLFSMAINWKLYGVLVIRIKVLVLLRIDERLSDTGLRE